MAGGGNYIKLDRRILNWKWYSDPNTRAVFIHCLLKASWKDGTWKGYDFKRGQFITSLPNLATELSLTIQQTRTALAHLKSTGELTEWTDKKVRIITVNNYDAYQSVNRHANRQSTDNQQTEQQSINRQINSNIRNNKEEEEKKERKKEIRADAHSLFSSFEEDLTDAESSEEADRTRREKMGGKLGRGVVMLSDEQIDSLLDQLTKEEFDHYVSVIAENELKGNHYSRRTHYQAILDMAAIDRKV